MKKFQDNWFKEWFDSKHYHILYSHRDFSEAENFINSLFAALDLNKQSKVLDLACGKGRHAIQVHELGFQVTGIDLSPESIRHAKQFEEKGLNFEIGDMRNLQINSQFDLVLNLFTSFGYFQDDKEDQAAMNSMADSLVNGGLLVIDYLNSHYVESNLPTEETQQKEGIIFQIKKFIEDSFIVKDIRFVDQGNEKQFQEFVKRINFNQFKTYLEQAGLKIVNTFGDYQLNSFEKENSERLIIVAKKCKM